MLPVEAKRNFWSGLRSAQEGAGALDVGRLGDLRLLLAGRVADDRREVDDRVDAVEGLLDGRRRRETSPLISSKKRFWQQGSRPWPPNLSES